MWLIPTFASRLGFAVVAASGEPVDSREAAELAAAASRIELLVLDIEGTDTDRFTEALATRLPERRSIPAGNPTARKGVSMWGYVQIRPQAGGWTLALILSDGRGYYRDIAGREGGEDPRLLANTLSNLIASVEEDALQADAEDVSMPDEIAPDPASTPIEPSTEPPPRQHEPANEPPDEPPRFEVGPYLAGLVLIGAGPPSPTGVAGGGGELGVDVRFRNGATFGASVRGIGNTSANFSLARFRAGVFAGYGWRRGAFELLALVGIAAEPWFVRAGGSTENLRSGNGDSSAAATALGGLLRVTPSYRHAFSKRLALRIGPALQVAGSSVLAGGGGVARVRDQSTAAGETLFRIGGLELSGGVELGFWWAAKRR